MDNVLSSLISYLYIGLIHLSPLKIFIIVFCRDSPSSILSTLSVRCIRGIRGIRGKDEMDIGDSGIPRGGVQIYICNLA